MSACRLPPAGEGSESKGPRPLLRNRLGHSPVRRSGTGGHSLRTTTSRSAGRDCSSLMKPAVFRGSIEAPLAIELDESEQWPTRRARTFWLLLSTDAGVSARTRRTPAPDGGCRTNHSANRCINWSRDDTCHRGRESAISWEGALNRREFDSLSHRSTATSFRRFARQPRREATVADEGVRASAIAEGSEREPIVRAHFRRSSRASVRPGSPETTASTEVQAAGRS